MQQTSQIEAILQCWGIDAIANWQAIQDNIAHITLADGDELVLKALGPSDAAKIARLHFEHDVLRHVAQARVSVAVPLRSDQGTPYVLDRDHLYRLSHWLPNRPVDPQTDQERVRLYRNYGAAIGHFHQALASYRDEHLSARTWRTDLQTRVLDDAVSVILAQLDRARLPAFEAALAEIQPDMISAYVALPTQPIIWDCHPGNVAVEGFEVSGFIDCDHISLAPRIFDLADFLVHLIKWDVGEKKQTARWLAHFPQLIAGYETVTPLSGEERAALFYAMTGIPLIFLDFFLQGDRKELVEVELDTFGWLVRHRREILAQLAS